jgi:KipI family sensor histidine kinase inhibitor
MEVRRCGDLAVLVELEDLDAVLALYATLDEEPVPGVVDMVPAARALVLHLDPTVTDVQRVADAVRRRELQRGHRQRTDTVEVPVVYDGEDLADVAGQTGLSVAEVVAAHTGQEWTVAFGGFAPGFGYLVGEDDRLHVARRDDPRTKVPAGAVALAGEFSGVYPRESPGGWQLIGHTELATWDITRDPPALLTPGARVRFVERR